MATFVASRTATSLLQNRFVDYALLGLGGLAVYELWDYIKVFFELGKEGAEITGKLGEELGKGFEKAKPAIEEGTKIIGDVIGDLGGEGLPEDTTPAEAVGVGALEGTLGPFGVIVPFVQGLIGGKDEEGKNCKGYEDQLAQLDEFNDWRPQYIQDAIYRNMKIIGKGSLYDLENGHRNYIKNVKGGIADFEIFDQGNNNHDGSFFTMHFLGSSAYKCPIPEYKGKKFPIGLNYVLRKAGKEEDGNAEWLNRSQQWIVDKLNAESIASTYMINNNSDNNMIVHGAGVHWHDEDGIAKFAII